MADGSDRSRTWEAGAHRFANLQQIHRRQCCELGELLRGARAAEALGPPFGAAHGRAPGAQPRGPLAPTQCHAGLLDLRRRGFQLRLGRRPAHAGCGEGHLGAAGGVRHVLPLPDRGLLEATVAAKWRTVEAEWQQVHRRPLQPSRCSRLQGDRGAIQPAGLGVGPVCPVAGHPPPLAHRPPPPRRGLAGHGRDGRRVGRRGLRQP
mmetsp:Transcript_113403/g.326055  ORF Transcript_113403/g.326055 Transcript_113403/m.326055 type:complete len:206 (-) Transcript_113403:141-758(-)